MGARRSLCLKSPTAAKMTRMLSEIVRKIIRIRKIRAPLTVSIAVVIVAF